MTPIGATWSYFFKFKIVYVKGGLTKKVYKNVVGGEGREGDI